MNDALQWLRTSGPDVVAPDGTPVRLRGVGLGGWLNMENFITGYPATESAHRKAMREALGERRYELFFDSFLTHFFGPQDAAFIASLGMNCVRIPVNYRHWEDDARPFEFDPRGFAHLDRAIEACAAAGLYTVIDLHAVPARRTTTGAATTRSTSRCSGSTGSSRTGPSRCGRRWPPATQTGLR